MVSDTYAGIWCWFGAPPPAPSQPNKKFLSDNSNVENLTDFDFDKFYNFLLSQLLDWRFNPRQNIEQIKLTAEFWISSSEMKRIISHQCDLQDNKNIIVGAFCTSFHIDEI